MFCPNCGKNEADGTPFCSGCGAALTANAQAGLMPSAKDRGLTKKEFLEKEASPKTKQFSLFSLGAFALAALLILISVIVACNTAFYKIPFISALIPSEAEEEMDEIMEDVQDVVDDVREYIDDNEDELDLDDDEMDLVNDLLDMMEDLAKNPSLSTMIDTVNELEDLAKANIPEELEDRLDLNDLDEIGEISGVLGTVQTILYIQAIIIIVLAALAAFLKKTGFAVAAIIVNALPSILFAGFLWFILITAVLVVLCVLLSNINKEYKAVKPAQA